MIQCLNSRLFLRTAMFCLVMLVNLLAVSANGIPADNSGQKNTDQDLSQLEYRFFEHDYKKDSESDRLNRLEKFIFGSSRSGSVNKRLQRILAAVPNQASSNTKPELSKDTELQTENPISMPQFSSNETAQSSPATVNQETQTESTTNKSVPDQDSVSENHQNEDLDSPFDYTCYPRVNALEKELLGRTYTDDSLTQRLSRLEKKAFGSPSNNLDLSQRVNLLDEYADRHDLYGERSEDSTQASKLSSNFRNTDNFNSGTNNQGTNTSLPPSSSMTTTIAPNSVINTSANQNVAAFPQTAPFIGSANELVAMMEAQIFDHTYPNRPLSVRVKMLEKRVLKENHEKQNHKANLSDRVAKLWDTLHPLDKAEISSVISGINQTPSSNAYTDKRLGTGHTVSYRNKTGHHSWLHKLASAVGTVAVGVAEGAATAMSYSGYGYGMGGYGMGMPGYGYGMGGYGMGGYGMGGYGMGGYGMGGFW